MLNWWLGKPGVGSSSSDYDAEPPETPAPVFAARALRSALFGTPAPLDDTPFISATERATEQTENQSKTRTQNVSPARPPGILMTPGTATIRRKSVSFGHDVKDVVAVREGRRTGRNRPTRSASLTRALEIAKEEKSEKSSSQSQDNGLSTRRPSTLKMERFTQEKETLSEWRNERDYLIKPDLLEELSRDDPDGDMTMDLNQPHSQSGRYWKSEFHKYHEEAQVQMKRLLQYKEGAKDFARKKDAEVLDLNQKLKEEQRKNALLENTISGRTSRIPPLGEVNHDTDVSVPKLVKELAKQTALVEQYRRQIDDLKQVSENSAGRGRKNLLAKDVLSMTASTDPHVKLLREEIVKLQGELKTTEKENVRLQDENKKIKQDLAQSEFRLGKHSEKLEKRRASFDDMRRKKDEALDQLQATYDRLKEQAKSQRRDAEQLLKRRHDQVAELKKEISAGRQLETTVKDLQIKFQQQVEEHSRVVAGYEIQIAELKTNVVLGTDNVPDLRASIHGDPLLFESLAKHEAARDSPTRYRPSQIPLALDSTSRPLKATARHTWSETPVSSPPKPTHQPLSEVINNADPTTIPPLRSGPVQFTPAVHRFSDLAMPNPDFDLPSEEPSIEIVPTIPDRRPRISPRPGIVNIPLSPAKPSRLPSKETRIPSMDEKERHTSLASSRLNIDNSRVRREIAPDRAAAAKARLEQRLAEKKKALPSATGKENARI